MAGEIDDASAFLAWWLLASLKEQLDGETMLLVFYWLEGNDIQFRT